RTGVQLELVDYTLELDGAGTCRAVRGQAPFDGPAVDDDHVLAHQTCAALRERAGAIAAACAAFAYAAAAAQRARGSGAAVAAFDGACIGNVNSADAQVTSGYHAGAAAPAGP